MPYSCYLLLLPLLRPRHVRHQVLRTRCEKGDMYTSIGPVLIAVNPYKQLSMGGKGIYTSGVRDYYHRKVLDCAIQPCFESAYLAQQ